MKILIILGLVLLTNCKNSEKTEKAEKNGCYNRSRAVTYRNASNLPSAKISQEFFYYDENIYEYDIFGNNTINTHYNTKYSNEELPLDNMDLDSKTVFIRYFDSNPVRFTKENKKAKGFECTPKNGQLTKSEEYDKNNNLVPNIYNFVYTYNEKGDNLTTIVYESNSTKIFHIDIYTYTYNNNNDSLTKMGWGSSVGSINEKLWNYVYDNKGLVTTEIESTKNSIANDWSVKTYNYAYNEAGDIIWKSIKNAGSDEVTYYTYWPNGRLNVKWQTYNSATSYSNTRDEYDTFGNQTLNLYQSPLDDNFKYNYINKYDSNGNLIENTYFYNDMWQSKTGYENFNDKGNPGKEVYYNEDGSILQYILYEYTKR